MAYSEKQLQIINTAEKLFSCKGYDGASVRDIAEEAGINVAMISYYFGSKEKLMQAIIQERTNNIRIKIESLIKDETLDPFRKISILVDDYIQRIVEKQQFHKIMMYEQVLQKNPVVTGLLNELKTSNANLIEKLIKEGQEKGVFKMEVDVVFMMNTMFGTVMQTLMNKDYYRDFNKLQHLPDTEFQEQLKNKLSNYIKVLFKAILSYEA
jgi:AcrR family transcriptional regulator